MHSSNTIDLEKLLGFRGYGTLNAPLWFLGIEEGFGQRDDNPAHSVEYELAARSLWAPTMDARIASESINERYWERRDYSSVWRVMSQLARGILSDAEDWRDRDLSHRYVVERLGRSDGETFLGDVMPLPAKRTGAWHYASLFPSKARYEAAQWPERCALWKDLLAEHQPRFLVCYGKGSAEAQWNRYREILGSRGEYLLSRHSVVVPGPSTLAYLMPFFGQGQYSIDDLQEVIEDLRKRAL